MRFTLAAALGPSAVVVGICVSGVVRVAAAATIFVTVPDQRNAFQMRLDLRDAVPIGRPAKHVGSRPPMNRERRRSSTFDYLGYLDRVNVIPRAP